MPTISRGLIVAVAAALALTGCGSSSTGAGPASSVSPTSAAEASGSGAAGPLKKTSYPVTITDCGGRETTYDKAPDRVVTIDPSITEALLTLGLADRIVGFTQFFTPEQEWAPVKAEMDALPVINKGGNYPSREAIAAVSPDIVMSVYPYAFMDPLPDRAGWAKLGIASYSALGECEGVKAQDLSLLYQDLLNLGVIFDVQDKAESVVADLKRRVAEAKQRLAAAGVGAKVIVTHDGEKDHPGAYGSTANALISMAGSTYPFIDIPIDRAPSWEEFVAANPDAIWIVPDAGPSAAEVERQLREDPRTARLTAVADESFIVVPQVDATVESPRNVDGFESLVDQLIALENR